MANDLVCNIQDHGIRILRRVTLVCALEHAEVVVTIAKGNDMIYRQL